MLSAVQLFNNPMATFKSESFIVLSMIAWTYLLHAYYRSKKIDYKYFNHNGSRKNYLRNPDGSIKYWDLTKCVSNHDCPIDKDTINNLKFLIGLRNQIEHRKASSLDSYLSARYQACALNFNHYLRKLHGRNYGLDNNLALSLQFAELDYNQANIIKDKQELIPKNITAYIADFDHNLSDDEAKSERFAYRLIFSKILANRKGQADRVVEFVEPSSKAAKSLSKEYWVKQETEKPKYSATQVVAKIRDAGFADFNIPRHTKLWQKYDAKNPSKGYGVMVVNYWYWYQNWIEFLLKKLYNKK